MKRERKGLGGVRLANSWEIELRRLLFLDRGILDQVDKILAYCVFSSSIYWHSCIFFSITMNYSYTPTGLYKKVKGVGWLEIFLDGHFSFTSPIVLVGIAF